MAPTTGAAVLPLPPSRAGAPVYGEAALDDGTPEPLLPDCAPDDVARLSRPATADGLAA